MCFCDYRFIHRICNYLTNPSFWMVVVPVTIIILKIFLRKRTIIWHWLVSRIFNTKKSLLSTYIEMSNSVNFDTDSSFSYYRRIIQLWFYSWIKSEQWCLDKQALFTFKFHPASIILVILRRIKRSIIWTGIFQWRKENFFLCDHIVAYNLA